MNRTLVGTMLAAVFSTAYGESMEIPSLEDLLKTDVTSVSRKSQSLADVPAAAFVISAEDIRRSGAHTLPDVLRMVPGLEVARIDSGRYAVSARGFNGRFANKLQVLVDGRSIYHPIFSGVMWESDPLPLEDIERVEVIRGPGAAMWGANAVNGVINIISHSAKSQAGTAMTATVGNRGDGSVYWRQGGSTDERSHWKLSGQIRHAEPSPIAYSNGTGEDRLNNGVVDFRFDRELGEGRDLSVWANVTRSNVGDIWWARPQLAPTFRFLPSNMDQIIATQSLMARYRWLSEGGVESSLQGGVTQSGIDVRGGFKETRVTVDLDYQGRLPVGNHDMVWGFSHRTSSDEVRADPNYIRINYPQYTQRISGAFIHDDWTLVPEKLVMGMGFRFDHSNQGGQTLAPNASLLWTPTRTDSLWTRLSQAPRQPMRAEQHFTVMANAIPPQPPFVPFPIFIQATPNPNGLNPEYLRGAEVGYRKQFSPTFGADLSLYRYRYTGLRSADQGALSLPTLLRPYGVMIANTCNCLDGWVSGAELSLDWTVTPTWRLQWSQTWTQVRMDPAGSAMLQGDADLAEKSGPRYYSSLRSQWNLSPARQFDVWLRGAAGMWRQNTPLPNSLRVPGYVTLDLRYGVKLSKELEVAVSGRDLIGGRRTEYISDYLSSIPVVIRPSVFLTTRWSF